jgi:hypothetical protein
MIAIDVDTSGLPNEFRGAATVWIRNLLNELAPPAGPNEEDHAEVMPI